MNLYLYPIILFFIFISSPAFASGPNFNDTTNKAVSSNNPNFTGNMGIGTLAPTQELSVVGGNIGIGTTYGLVGLGTSAPNNSAILTLQSDSTSIYGGLQAGASTITGNLQSAALGYEALNAQQNTQDNTAVGYTALQKNTGTGNTAVGADAMQVNTGGYSTSVGFFSMSKILGGGNTAVGYGTLQGISSASAADNTAIGYLALEDISSGNYNTALGYYAGAPNSVHGTVLGSYNTWLGYNSGPSGTSDVNNSVGIGSYATAGANNVMVLGGMGGSALNVGIGTDMNGAAGSLIVLAAGNSNGNVGIGSLTPGVKLDVNGTIRSISGGFMFPDGSTQTSAASGGNSWTMANGNVYTTTGSNNVGIGTSVPGQNMVVIGNIGIGTSISNAQINSAWGKTNGGDLFVQGNVAIGSPSPTSQLIVFKPGSTVSSPGALVVINQSTFNGDGPALAMVAGLTGAQAIDFSSPSHVAQGQISFSNSTNQMSFETNNSSTAQFSIDSNGNVGIGTTTPVGGLAVMNGNVGIGTWVPVNNLDIVGNVGIGTLYAGVKNAPSNGLVVAGNVGIGTWGPTEALSIGGNERLDFSTPYSFGVGAGGSLGIFSGSSGSTQYITFGGGGATVGIENTGIFGWFPGGISGGPDTNLSRLSNGVMAVGIGTLYNSNGILVAGNIGLGTFKATNRLNIVGNIGIGTTSTDAYLTTPAPIGGMIVEGNVGIGTVSPSFALEVNGNIQADVQYNYPGGFGPLADSSGNLYIPQALFDSSVSPGVSGDCLTTTGSQVVWASCNGNVGVGTGFPSSPNHSVQFNNAGGFGGSPNFVFNGNNVGIGTTLSMNTLDVANNLSIGTAYAGYKAAGSNGLIVQGNVGIGTWVPVEPLDINLGTNAGEFTVFNNGFNSLSLTNRSGGALTLGTNNSGRVYIDSNGNVGVGTTLTNGGLSIMNGNVGIGTWAPGYPLDIQLDNGSTLNYPLRLANGTVSNGDETGIGFSLSETNTNPTAAIKGAIIYNSISQGYSWFRGDIQFLQRNTADAVSATIANVVMTIANNGNVGIGTTSPRGLLDVTGAIGSAPFVFTSSGNAGIGTAVPTGALEIEGGNVGIGTAFTTTSALTVMNGNVGVGTWLPGGALVVMNGNVGIAKSNPTVALDVTGQIQASSYIDGNSVYSTGGTFYTPNVNMILVAGNNTNQTDSMIFKTNNNGTANEAMRIAANGNIGIGTTVPGAALDVEGTLYPTVFYGKGTDYNVGIGSMTPGQALDVNGVVRSISGGFTFPDGTNQTTAAAGGSNYWSLGTGGNVGINTTNNVGIGTTFVGGTGEGLLVVMNGNVGIGTWVTPSLLTVGTGTNLFKVNSSGTLTFGTGSNGALSAASLALDSGTSATIDNASGSAGSNTIIKGGNSASSYLTLMGSVPTGNSDYIDFEVGNVGVGTVDAMRIVNGGNIGIGTWVPASALDVHGSINMSAGGTFGYTGSASTLSFNNITAAAVPFQFVGYYGATSLMSIDGESDALNRADGAAAALLSLGAATTINPASGASDFRGVNVGFTVNQSGTASGNYIAYFANVTETNALGANNRLMDLQVGGNSKFLIKSNGNVGIGSIAPSGAIDVGAGSICLGHVCDSSWPSGSSQWATQNVTDVSLAGGNVGIGTTKTTAAALSVMNGNVGIGTWVPNSALTITGNMNFLTPSGGGTGIVALNMGNTPTFQLEQSTGNYLETDGAGHVYTGKSGGGNLPLLLQDNGSAGQGNVGVATTTANSTFVVNGSIAIGTGTPSAYLGTAAPSGGLIVQNNVGIGSVSPGQALDVAGTVRMTGFNLNTASPTSGYVLTTDSSGNGTWQAAASGTSYWLNNGSSNVGINTTQAVGIGTSFVGGTGEATLSIMNGNVGIGTWVPADTFQVGKYKSTSSGFEIDSNGNVGIGTTITNFAPLTIMNGNVGIGTFSPTARFQIGSVADTSNQLSIQSGSSSGSNSIVFNTIGSYNNVIGDFWETPGLYFEIRDNSNDPLMAIGANDVGSVGIGGSSAVTSPKMYIQSTGNVGIGTWVPANLLDVKGNVGIGTTVNPYTLVADTGNGNVGIGVAVPQTTLDIRGTDYNVNMRVLNNSSTTNRFPGITIQDYSNTGMGNPVFNFYDSRGSVGSPSAVSSGDVLGAIEGFGEYDTSYDSNEAAAIYFIATDNFSLTHGGGAVLFDTTANGTTANIERMRIDNNGNVGIGTTTPVGGLSVMNGNVGIGTWVPAQALQVNAPGNNWVVVNSTSGNNAGFQYQSSGSSKFYGGVTINNAVWDYTIIDPTGNIQLLDITPTGNVGIGTVSPVGGLAVMNGNVGIGTWVPKGTLDVGATGTICLGGTCNSTWPSGSSQWATQNVTDVSLAGGNVGIGTTKTTAAALSVMNGNVGIGTWVPSQLFQVGSGTGALIVSNLSVSTKGLSVSSFTDSSLATINGNVGIGTTITGNAGLSIMNGNVGIGTWVPAYALDIKGSERASNLLDTGNAFQVDEISVVSIGNSQEWFGDFNGAGYPTAFYANGKLSAYISTTGNMGIGTTTPVAGLAVMNGNVGIGTWVPVGALQVVGAGNVGINSTNPGKTLDVNGVIRMTGFNLSTSPTNGYVLTSDASGNGTWQVASGGGSSQWTTQNVTDVSLAGGNVGIGTTITNAGAALSVMNGNVGIGTWVPQYALDVENGSEYVNGSINIAPYADLFLNAGAYIAFNNQTSIATETSAFDSQSTLVFNTDVASPAMVVDGANVGIGTSSTAGGLVVMNGNVGIGTWVPGELLQVNDSAMIGGTNNSAPGLNSFEAGDYNSAGGGDSIAMGGANIAGGTAALALGYDTGSYGFASVAIGGATNYGPDAFGDFSIALGGATVGVAYGQGNGYGNYSMGIGLGNPAGTQPAVTGTSSFGIFMGDQSNANITGNNIMAILGGNVGIGTWAPQAALQVANGAIYGNEQSVSPSGSSATVNWSNGNQQSITLASATAYTITFSNFNPGQTLRLVLCQSSGGNATVSSWAGGTYDWSGGGAPTLTSTANKCDVLTFMCTNAKGSTQIFGSSVQNF